MKLGDFYRIGLMGLDNNNNFCKLDHIGVVRKYLSVEDQKRYLPNDSFCIISTSHLYGDSFKLSEKIKFVCHPFGSEFNHWYGGRACYDVCESDMVDPSWCINKHMPSVVDVMCITNNSPHGMSCKGFHYIPCIHNVCKKNKWSFMVVDYTAKDYKKTDDKSLIEVRNYIKKNKVNIFSSKPKLKQKQINKIMQGARILCIPNYLDASPKIITESIIRGVPVSLGSSIVGGKKYINDNNGLIFKCASNYEIYLKNKTEYEDSLENSLSTMLNKKYDRKNMCKTYLNSWGLLKTSQKIADILKSHKIIDVNIKQVFYPEFTKNIGKINEILYK